MIWVSQIKRKMQNFRVPRQVLLSTVYCLLFTVHCSLLPALAEQLDESEQRGKRIFTEGTAGDEHEIKAVVGGGSALFPGKLMLCANCHGRDGRGKPEGGMFPSDITWSSLTRPYEVTSKSGRKRPAYDEKLLIRAITMGIDSGGKPLENVMPRYRLTQQQAADLVSYLKVLETEPERGVSDDAIKIGALLAPKTGFPTIHETARGLLTAFAERQNQAGGVFGRKIQVCFADLPTDPEKRGAATRDFIDREQPFALIASFLAGSETDITQVVESRAIPLLGTITWHPEQGSLQKSAGVSPLSRDSRAGRSAFELRRAKSRARRPAGAFRDSR